MTLCGICDKPITLTHDTIYGHHWTHTGTQPACIPQTGHKRLATTLTATPQTDPRKRRDYTLIRGQQQVTR